MAKINFEKQVWEGWTVRDFIDALETDIDMIMTHQSWRKPFETKAALRNYCKENQPYYKKTIPDVVNYFADKYCLK